LPEFTTPTRKRRTLRAVLGAGVLSAALIAAAATPAQAIAYDPTPATHVTVVRGSSTTASIRWSDPYDAGISGLGGYRVARDGYDSYGNGPAARIVSAGTHSFTFQHLLPGMSYNLSVRPLSGDSSIGFGQAVVIRVWTYGARGAVTNFTARRTGTNYATITWSAPPVLAGKTVTGYIVARNGYDITGTGPYSHFYSASTRSNVQTKLYPGDDYTFSVQPVYSDGVAGPKASGGVEMWNY
jgi:hypothetical protein